MFKKIRDYFELTNLDSSHMKYLLYFLLPIIITIAEDIVLSIVKNQHLNHIWNHIFTGLIISSVLLAVFKLLSLLKELNQVNKKLNQDELSYKIASIMSSNIDHQIKSPILAIKGSFSELKSMIETIIKVADPTGKRDIDKLIYGCTEYNSPACKTCMTKVCQKEPIMKNMIRCNEDVVIAIKQMEDTIKVMKGNKEDNKSLNTDLYTVINNAIMVFRMLHKNGIKFEVDERFKEIEIDKAQRTELVNVFHNHINNSIDAHAYFVAFRYKDYDYENKKVIFYIVDDGDGIPENMVNKIWDYKVSTKGDGRGFGMFLCRQLLRSSGGNEKIASTSPAGTILEIEYPAIKKQYLKGENDEQDRCDDTE